MNEYVAQQLDKLQPLRTQIYMPTGESFRIKITSPFGTTHWMNVPYDKYFRIAQILLESE